MRFFRADAQTYEAVRRSLDASWMLPDETGTTTCFAPIDKAPKDLNGLPVLAVHDHFCEYEAVAAVLPGLLSSGAVTEITEDQYFAALPQVP